MKRFGIIGAGKMARSRANALRSIEGVTLAAVISKTKEKTLRFAEEYGVDTVLTNLEEMTKLDLDAILIETPNYTHYKYVKWALSRGLDVFVEGPLCVTVSEAEELIRLSKDKRKIVEVGFDSRYSATIEKAKEVLEAGEIGEPVIAHSTAMIPMRECHQSWYYSQDLSGGMPLTHMSYCYINMFRWLMGDPIGVYAQANRKVYTEVEKVTEETCIAILRWPNNALASISASYIAPRGFPIDRPKIICTQGGLVIGDSELIVYQRGGTTIFKPPASPSILETFVRCIESREEGRNPPSDAIVDVKIAEAISKSCKTNSPILL